MAEGSDGRKRTKRGGLWHELLVRKAVVLTVIIVAVLSSASWLWDELYPQLPRPKLIEVMQWFPWYAWVIVGLVVLIGVVGEHAYKLIYAAEQETEETKARIYDGRPKFVLDVIGQPQWDKKEPAGEFIFRLINCGERTARYVTLKTQTSRSGKFFLRFEELATLDGGRGVPLGYSLNDSDPYEAGKLLDQHMLWQFLNDSQQNNPDPPSRVVLIWFDIEITYRDMNDTIGNDIVRLCFDFEKRYLYATEVPYTRSPPPLRSTPLSV